jgi:rod shape-determining protein MreC
VAILKNRSEDRNNLRKFFELIGLFLQKVKIFIILIISVATISLNFRTDIGKFLLDSTYPIISTFESGFIYVVDLFSIVPRKLNFLKNFETENNELKKELITLKEKNKYLESLLAENSALKELLNFKESNGHIGVSARLLASSITPISHRAVIAGGYKAGIQQNDIVASANGLVGKIEEVSENYSKVMLLTDSSSRVPVITSISHQKALLVGDNEKIKLTYLDNNNNLELGEEVWTSGDGEIYPFGLKVAVITSIGEEVELKQIVDIKSVEFVTVYQFIK